MDNVIVVETNRSNQVAFMRRLADEHSTPRIEVDIMNIMYE